MAYNEYKIKKYTEAEPQLIVEGAFVNSKVNRDWEITFEETNNKYELSSDGKIITGPISETGEISEIPITSTTINSGSINIDVGETEVLTLTINPNNATEELEWISSDEDIVTVTPSADGKTATIEGLAEGTAIISATGSTNVCTVHVTDPNEMCCFDAASPVLMADGTTKNIEEVKIGDKVMSLNEDTGEFISQIVKNTVTKHNSNDLVYVYLSNGKKIGMRAYHPLLTTEGYKSLRPELAETMMEVGNKVELLEVGDTLIGYEENVTIISIEKRPEIENYDTYNLSIEGQHNYIVNGIVVHNAPHGSGGPSSPSPCAS